MKISLSESRKEVNKNTPRVKLVMMLFVVNLMALNTVLAQGNMGNDKSDSSSYTIAYSWNGINLTDNEGKSKNKINAIGGYAAWSPDGKRFAYYAKYDERRTWSIHTMNSDGTNSKRLTHVKNMWDNSPTWSPDGTKIAFSREYEDSENNWNQEVWIMNSDGSQQTQIKPIKGGGPYFTPDGRIVYHSEASNNKTQISIADIDGSNIIRLTHNEAEEQHPEVSPDGKQIAFMSDRSGSKEIYVMNIDGSNQKQLTFSEAAKWYPSWSPDGSKLIFSSTSSDGERNIHMMNKDGSSLKRIISNGTQPAWSKVEHANGSDSPSNSYRDIENPYFGEKPPGLIPEVFAPGIVSLKERVQGSVSFSPDLAEMYFSAKKKSENWDGSVYFSRLENNQWTDLKKANFTNGESIAEGSPFVSPDGKRIYFLDDKNKIQYVNRFEDSWSDAIQLDLPIDDDDVIFSPNEAKNGDLYYFNLSKFKLYSAPNKNGEFPEAREVDVEFGVHNYISPSQDFLLVDDRDHHEDETRKDNDIYVYFKKKDGTWTKPINLGNEVNSHFPETSPRVTPDGKYLFFSRYIEDAAADIYWVSTEVIERLRPDDL